LGLGPLSATTGFVDELAYDEPTKTWYVWEETPPAMPSRTALPASEEKFAESNYTELAQDPSAHRGAEVDVTGQVLSVIESTADSAMFQILVDPDGSRLTATVMYPGKIDLREDDPVYVVGQVAGLMRFKNGTGEKLSEVEILAVTVKKINLEQIREIPVAEFAPGPPVKTVKVGKTLNRDGYKVTVDQVEYRPNEARVFVTAVNSSQRHMYFTATDGNTLQPGDELKRLAVTTDYPQVKDDLAPGEKSSGVVVFRWMQPGKPFSLHFDAYDLESYTATFDFEIEP